jgi:putative SOS response-associated peptidase YedK
MFGPVVVSQPLKRLCDGLGLDIGSELDRHEPQYNIAPSQRALVVYKNHDKPKCELFHWGLIPSWAVNAHIGTKTFNARAETVAENEAYRNAFKTRRCLVPASGYFEWKGEPSDEQPYFIHAPNRELMLFAGLWESWRDPLNETIHSFTILTGNPGAVSGDIQDRQPIVLPPDLCERWLDDSPLDAVSLLHDVPESKFEYYPVMKAVGSSKNKGSELVEPIQR